MRPQKQEICCYVCGGPAEQARVLVDIDLAAKLCRVSRPTLYRWMRRELVEWAELPHGRRRLYLDSLFRDPIIPQDIMPAYPPRRYRRRKTDSGTTSSETRKAPGKRKRRRRSKWLLRSRSAWEKFRRRLRGKEGAHA
jgi:hypothetical protein